MNYFDLKTNAIYPMAIGMALMLPVSQSFAICFFGCTETRETSAQVLHINETVSVAQQAEKFKVLQDLQEEMIGKFASIENLLSSNNNTQALSEAKKVLDTVRVKTGIDPKSKITESFLVPTIFPESSVSFEDLNRQQQSQVIKSIRDFRGGLYMDIMNLSKRTTLLYIKAFKAVVQENGGLKEDDRNKIVNDLVRASLVPMTVEDKKGKQIIVFDEDVSNEDHIYLFNRELKLYLNSEADLHVDEKKFSKLRTQMKDSILPRRIYTSDTAKACIDVGKSMMPSGSYDKEDERRIAASYSYQKSCFQKYYKKFLSYDDCNEVAEKLRNWKYDEEVSGYDQAKITCFDYYNK